MPSKILSKHAKINMELRFHSFARHSPFPLISGTIYYYLSSVLLIRILSIA